MEYKERTIEEIEDEQKQEILKAIENNNLYDWLTLNFWKMNNTRQFELLKEVVYILETNRDKKELIENIKEYL